MTNARTRIASLYAADVKAAQNGGRDDQRKLAKELLRVAEEEPDPAARYVLLCWANNLAIQAMDCGIVQQAVTALARRYELDAVDCHVWAWLKLLQSMGNAKDHPELPVVTDYGLFVLTTLVDHDRFEQLDSISGRLHELSKSATDLRVRDAIRQRLRNAETLGAAYARVDHTGNSPDLGRYYCLLKGDWDRGLPLLASTDGLALAEAAKLDLQKPLDTKSQKTVADKWFAQYQGSPRNSLERTNLRARALYWYSKALASPNLTGLDRTEAERRRTELASATPQPIPGPAPLRLRNQGNFFPIPQKTVADLRRDKMHLEVVGCKGSLQTNVANPRAAFGQPVIIRVPEFAGIQIHVQLTEEGGQTGLAVAPKFEMAPNRVDDFNPESIRRIRNDIQAPVQEARRKLNDRLATRERILRDIDEVALFYPRNFAQKAWKLTTLRNLNVNLGQVNQSITTLSERTIPRLERGAQEAEQRLGHAEGFFGAWPGDLQIHCRVLAQVQEQETEIMTAIIGGAQQT